MAPYPDYGAPPWGYGMPAGAFAPLGEEAELPPVGALHCFHTESHGFGTVTPDLRQFRKGVGYEGRLSVLSEAQVHRGGRHRYLLQFTYGPLGKADGCRCCPRRRCTAAGGTDTCSSSRTARWVRRTASGSCSPPGCPARRTSRRSCRSS